MKSKNFTIPYVIYPFDIMFSFGESDSELHRKLKKGGISDYSECELFGITQAKTIMFREGPTLIRMKRIPKSPEDFGHLHHEIFHAVDFLFTRISIELCEKSGEAYAYLIQYLTEQVYKRI